MVMKSKSFNAVFCVPRLKLSINGLFAALSMGGLLILRLSPPRRLPAPCTCKHQLWEKVAGTFQLGSRATWVAGKPFIPDGCASCEGTLRAPLRPFWARVQFRLHPEGLGGSVIGMQVSNWCLAQAIDGKSWQWRSSVACKGFLFLQKRQVQKPRMGKAHLWLISDRPWVLGGSHTFVLLSHLIFSAEPG